MHFLDLLNQSKEESKSQVCVGLDLATFGTREQDTLAEGQEKVAVIINLIKKLQSQCCAFKINRQYILDFTLAEIQQITQISHDHGKPIIIDHKLSDIGSTNQQAIQHFVKEGFDAFTASPFPGNVQELCKTAHNSDLAVILLILMSNKEAIWMKEANIKGNPVFQYNARLANQFADGVVIGATGHVSNEDLVTMRSEISGKVVLAPGVGAQGGDVKLLIDIFHSDVIFNVGRSIIYQSKPLRTLQSYNELVKKHTG